MVIRINLQTHEDYILNLKDNMIIKENGSFIDFHDKRVEGLFSYRKEYKIIYLHYELGYLLDINEYSKQDWKITNYFIKYILPFYIPKKLSIFTKIKTFLNKVRIKLKRK